MSEGIKYEDIPEEVWEAWAIRLAKVPIGFEMYNRLESIIKKHPDFFPWETKYETIPREVHDAYRKEAYPYRDMLLSLKSNDEIIGLIPELSKDVVDEITKEPVKTITQMFSDLFKAEQENRIRKDKERARRKELWDKHYAKYGLEYRE